jgi:hypothetical protein
LVATTKRRTVGGWKNRTRPILSPHSVGDHRSLKRVQRYRGASPESSAAEAIAREIRPRLSFLCADTERLLADGRWDNTDQPQPFKPKLVPTTLGLGEERALHIVAKFPDDVCAYAFNDYSYDHPGMKNPAYRLAEREYHVAVRLRGVGVNAVTHLILKQELDGSDPTLQVISHEERADGATT